MARFNYNIEQVRSAFAFALHTVPVESLEALFAKFGYKADEICVDAAIAAWKRYGNEFMIPFSELANDVLTDEEQMGEIKRHWLSIARSDGKQNTADSTTTTTSGDGKTSQQKWESAKGVISDIFGFGMQGYAAYSQIKANETANDEADEPTPQPETQQSSFPWVAVGIGALVLILVVVLIVAVAKKK